MLLLQKLNKNLNKESETNLILIEKVQMSNYKQFKYKVYPLINLLYYLLNKESKISLVINKILKINLIKIPTV